MRLQHRIAGHGMRGDATTSHGGGQGQNLPPLTGLAQIRNGRKAGVISIQKSMENPWENGFKKMGNHWKMKIYDVYMTYI